MNAARERKRARLAELGCRVPTCEAVRRVRAHCDARQIVADAPAAALTVRRCMLHSLSPQKFFRPDNERDAPALYSVPAYWLCRRAGTRRNARPGGLRRKQEWTTSSTGSHESWPTRLPPQSLRTLRSKHAAKKRARQDSR